MVVVLSWVRLLVLVVSGHLWWCWWSWRCYYCCFVVCRLEVVVLTCCFIRVSTRGKKSLAFRGRRSGSKIILDVVPCCLGLRTNCLKFTRFTVFWKPVRCFLFCDDAFPIPPSPPPSPLSSPPPLPRVFGCSGAATSVTIVSGAIAERVKIAAYVMYAIVLTSFIYPLVRKVAGCCLVWGRGLLLLSLLLVVLWLLLAASAVALCDWWWWWWCLS